jgi:5-methylcytosine-specific restriction endonuclease McrA
MEKNKNLICFLTTDEEEAAVESLASCLKLENKELFENSLYFLAQRKYFLTDNENQKVEKLKGLGTNKIERLARISQRILNNEYSETGIHFFSNYHYSIALGRYKNILERNFRRILDENLYQHVYFKFRKSWGFPFTSESALSNESDLIEILSRDEYKPIKEWLNHHPDKALQKKIKEISANRTEVRFKNILFEKFSLIHKTVLTELAHEYEEHKHFHSILPKNEFLNYFGPNENLLRTCEYCSIREKDIERLVSYNLIFSKRIYTRGMTMEVDKRDPRKEYHKDNLIMSCYWCNNAKTDEFTEKEFKILGQTIKSVWRERLRTTKKKIYCGQYDGPHHATDLNYISELKAAKKMISSIKIQHPEMSDDEAFLFFRNSISSAVSYSIHEDLEEE